MLVTVLPCFALTCIFCAEIEDPITRTNLQNFRTSRPVAGGISMADGNFNRLDVKQTHTSGSDEIRKDRECRARKGALVIKMKDLLEYLVWLQVEDLLERLRDNRRTLCQDSTLLYMYLACYHGTASDCVLEIGAAGEIDVTGSIRIRDVDKGSVHGTLHADLQLPWGKTAYRITPNSCAVSIMNDSRPPVGIVHLNLIIDFCWAENSKMKYSRNVPVLFEVPCEGKQKWEYSLVLGPHYTKTK
jgi:hypothetical protein